MSAMSGAATKIITSGVRSAARRILRAVPPLPRLDRYRPVNTLALPQHEVPRAAVPAVDAHNHLGRWLTRDGGWMAADRDALLACMDTLNLRLVINLDGRWGKQLEDNLDRYDRWQPDRFATFCHVDWTELSGPTGVSKLVASLRDSASRGARGLKVWKDLGRDVHDASGKLILPDDPALDELWATAGECGLPILMHVGDPRAFFLPTDRRNERLEEIRRHRASWRRPGLPEHGRLLEAFRTIVARHPGTTWVGAHMASNCENLEEVSQLLDENPNLFVDMAARVGDLGRQPRATLRLVARHPERVLFGTDVFPLRPEEVQIYFRFLETDDECFTYSTADPPPAGRWDISGLNLPTEVLRKVYADNALRMLGSA